jgi:hypothetical protein
VHGGHSGGLFLACARAPAGFFVGRRTGSPAAVRAGELDDLFTQAAKTGTVGKPRKAA